MANSKQQMDYIQYGSTSSQNVILPEPCRLQSTTNLLLAGLRQLCFSIRVQVGSKSSILQVSHPNVIRIASLPKEAR